ncbi:MAG: glutathione S-transferase family protein [Phenylobacterium sp.]|uniref:glutathione S-transferase family protein n=1 Tax=Phenylobacterium sp. TaxID=1871053 RepID=UPI00391B6A06
MAEERTGGAAGEIILHHYDTSPFSEKVRLLLGLKGLAWRSVVTPNIMPKPELTPLTGGYRRAPVMQIGADIYCDSQVILAEIEARAPGPRAASGGAWALNLWADRLFFGVTVPVIFGELGDAVDPAFVADREKLSGRPFDVAAMKAAGEPMRQQWRAQAAWIDDALEGRDFLDGDAPGLSDISAYMNVWFLAGAVPKTARELMTGLERLQAWAGRVQAIGHGDRREMSGAEALEVARAATPAAPPAHDVHDPLGAAPGDPVVVSADDYGRDPIDGRLVAATPQRIVIARDASPLGRLHVHFPRAGYVARRADPGPEGD